VILLQIFIVACHCNLYEELVKAIILAAGKGTRMRELTNELPKPMLKVHDKPILQHIIEGIAAAGVKEFFIITGFKAEVIEDYFGDGAKWGLRIAYGRQTVQDGTGKAPELAKEFVGPSPFFLSYGDILVDPKTYKDMVHRYNEDYFSGVLTVTGSEDVTKGGLVFFDEKFRMKRLVEKPSPAQLDELKRDGSIKPGDTFWYNAGVYIFRPSLFEFTAKLQKSPRGEFELTDAISGLAASNHPIAGMQIAGRWVDVRDPEVLAKLERESQR
jgi:NDP-sugar pyrophosphorylase family protein